MLIWAFFWLGGSIGLYDLQSKELFDLLADHTVSNGTLAVGEGMDLKASSAVLRVDARWRFYELGMSRSERGLLLRKDAAISVSVCVLKKLPHMNVFITRVPASSGTYQRCTCGGKLCQYREPRCGEPLSPLQNLCRTFTSLCACS